MAWTHKVLSKGLDAQNVIVVTVEFTDGTSTLAVPFRGVNKAQLIEQVRNHIRALNDRDATVGDATIDADAVLDLTIPQPAPLTQNEIDFFNGVTRLRQLTEAVRLGVLQSNDAELATVRSALLTPLNNNRNKWLPFFG